MSPALAAAGGIVRVSPAGDRAFLVDLLDIDAVLGLQGSLRVLRPAGLVEVVAAALTVLVVCESAVAARRIAAILPSLSLAPPDAGPSASMVIDTVYDGDDLDDVTAFTGLGRDAVIALHTGSIWRAAFIGFAPGFAYLTGGDRRLLVPRRATPRIAVPAGAVAIADEYSAVYPAASPGGWQLIGRTAARLWDPARDQPASIQPGDTVVFRAVRELIVLPDAPSPIPRGDAAVSFLVLSPGPLSTMQDLGRPGRAHLGVPAAGALDRAAHRRANRLVGNTADTTTIESLAGGLALTALTDQVCAITGGLRGVRVRAGRMLPSDAPFALLAGETLELGGAGVGIRGYLAVRGGFIGERMLGSASTDTLAGLGPAPLAAGDHLVVGEPAGVVGEPETPPIAPTALRFVPGPRRDWFDGDALDLLAAAEWVVTPSSNRIGLRLDGPSLVRSISGELASEGLACGSIQVPPDGRPIIFLADHPVTGGYPVIGVVVSEDLDAAAQLAPGASLRLVEMGTV